MVRRDRIACTGIGDLCYPERLYGIARPPLSLYYKGDIRIVSGNSSIALIGSRQPSARGKELAYRAGHLLGKRRINVVNGLALGCDTYALTGALAAGGKCAAILPCGPDRIVPRSNILLAERISDMGGCILSEYPCGTEVQKYRYVERDRLQSGISDAVVVIEAGLDSGTMHTVRYAIQQGRRLACFDSRSVGNAPGNEWLGARNGVEVLRSLTDLDRFIRDVPAGRGDAPAFCQMTLEELH